MLNTEYTDELDILAKYNLNSIQEGLKIHHDAPENIKQAAIRLFHKGLITQEDGGYLTDRGIEAAEHIQRALNIIRPN
ncbi:MAG: TIGR02647 family protein [Kangiellaceae bacterium]|nr:TIGR02647 family protein [Kangiellaceae bacterium]